MCRFYGFRANEPTKVECTLVHAQNALMIQSRADKRGESHSDGWGVGFYNNGQPEVERRALPAFQDAHFSATAQRVYAKTVVAHVRKATVGGPLLANTHPFRFRDWLFAHNGTVTGFERARFWIEEETEPRFARSIGGTTDSELVFAWLLSRMHRDGMAPDRRCDDLDKLVGIFAEALPQLAYWSKQTAPQEPSRLNFLLTDGTVMLASRWNNSLYWVGRKGIRDCEICGVPHVHHTRGTHYRALEVASEPISHEPWQEVPERSIVSIDADVRMQVHAL